MHSCITHDSVIILRADINSFHDYCILNGFNGQVEAKVYSSTSTMPSTSEIKYSSWIIQRSSKAQNVDNSHVSTYVLHYHDLLSASLLPLYSFVVLMMKNTNI